MLGFTQIINWVNDTLQMSQTMDKMSAINVQELSEEELSLKPFEREIVISKRNRRKQAIMGMISQNPHVGVEAMAERLDVNEKTIRRDIGELKRAGVF